MKKHKILLVVGFVITIIPMYLTLGFWPFLYRKGCGGTPTPNIQRAGWQEYCKHFI